MIRINLLPVRQVKKRELGRQVLVLFSVVLLFGAMANYFWYSSRESVFTRNQQEMSVIQAQIQQLKEQIGEVEHLNKRKKDVQDKLKILTDLRKGRAGPVKMMDALSTAMPAKAWLNSFQESGNAVRISGSAVSHDDVAELMRQLSNVVWTPKGMGRLVEQKRDAKTSRVELLALGSSIEDFPVGEVAFFFTGIELRQATQADTKDSSGNSIRAVSFEISFGANYAI